MYRVLWESFALRLLADVWIDASSNDRAQITDAVSEADRLLKFDPLDIGESRAGIERIAFFGPLGILFEVHEREEVVKVLEVWSIRG